MKIGDSQILAYYDSMPVWSTCPCVKEEVVVLPEVVKLNFIWIDDFFRKILSGNKHICAIGTGGGCRVSFYLLG